MKAGKIALTLSLVLVTGSLLLGMTGCSSNNPSAEDASKFYSQQGAKETNTQAKGQAADDVAR